MEREHVTCTSELKLFHLFAAGFVQDNNGLRNCAIAYGGSVRDERCREAGKAEH